NAHVSWRVFAGSTFHRPPRELLFDAGEGSRVDSLDRFYLNDGGPLLASGHYLLAGGGGLRGYRGRAALGKGAWGAGADVGLPGTPVTVFADLGRIEGAGGDLVGRALADAGIASVAGPRRLAIPLWGGPPGRRQSPWRLRWVASVRSFPIALRFRFLYGIS